MISRRKCQAIAWDWVGRQAIAESKRRLDSTREPHLSGAEISPEDRRKLNRLNAKMLLQGGYDPPTPRIPWWGARLFMNDWTPPPPTSKTWRMYTGPEPT